MKCPLCNGETIVASTVESGEDFVKRKRKCISCKSYFFTMEKFNRWTKQKDFNMDKANIQAQADLEAMGLKLDPIDIPDLPEGKGYEKF